MLRARITTGLLLVFFFSCASPELLTRVTAATPDATCASGGVVIATGRDTNGNGALDDAEVKDQSTVCNGGASGGGGKTQLVQSTDLSAGDPTCAQGGVRLDFGFDDGANGGAADNGKLEAGEVTSTRFVCNGGVPWYPGSVAAPASPAGTFRIDTGGGNGDGAPGGAAGAIGVRIRSGTLGGNTRVFKTGVTDAAFSAPNSGTFAGGSVPLPVTANLTINAFATVGDGLGSGEPFFLVNNDESLYRNMSGAAVATTAIDVASGQTLTFRLNFGNDARVRLRNDVKSSGTITTALLGDNLSRGNLVLTCGTYFGEAGSTLFLRGEDDANVAGGAGGSLTLVGTARVVNQGAVVTSGGNGTDGAPAGSVLFATATGEVFNTGSIEAKGGMGSVGPGGNGGNVALRPAYRGVRNSGTVDTSGGMGGPNGGGGGQVTLAPIAFGSVLNSGTLTTRGGPCADVDCNGGSAGQVALDSFGGELRNSGAVTATGADGRGLGNGGNGALVHVFTRDGAGNGGTLSSVTGDLQLSGNLVTRGGAGNQGGAGGAVDIVLEATNLPRGQQLTLFGYSELLANGGSSNAGGGAGGTVTVSNAPSTYASSIFGPGGAALNFANVSARGGAGTAGGPGGRFVLAAQTTYNFQNPAEYASNGATTIDLRGGNGSNGEGGVGGQLVLVGPTALNSAAVDASGGEVTQGGALSGQGGALDFQAPYGALSNTGELTVRGGNSTGDARGGGSVRLVGAPVLNSAAISCNGGNATNTAGAGGAIFLQSLGGTTSSTGVLTVAPGTGANANVRGTILVDGVDVTP